MAHSNWVPGIAPIEFSDEPLATEGMATPGPDNLSPAVPEERDELIRQGYIEPVEDVAEEVETYTDEPAREFEPFSFGGEPELPRF